MSADQSRRKSPFIRWITWHQFRLNCLASVAIEHERLRPLLKEQAWQ